jgi:hypothetical protein
MDIILKPSIKDRLRRAAGDITLFVRDVLEEDLHEQQEAWLRGSLFKTNSFLRAGNRWGKGDCGYFKGAYYGFYKPVAPRFKSKWLSMMNTSASQDQANIILKKFEERYKNKKLFLWMVDDIVYSPFPHIKFKNNVTWWFRNTSQDGKFLEGWAYFYINCDEADLIKGIPEITMNTIESRLWDYNGYLDIMTTPRRGKRNAYKVEKRLLDARDPKHNFTFIGNSLKNKFLPAAAVERMKRLPDRLFRQNVKAEWVDEGGAVSWATIERSHALATGLQSGPKPGQRFVNAHDLARTSTWCTRATLTQSIPSQLVSWERFREDADARNPEYWLRVEAKIKEANQRWPGKTGLDTTGLGDVVLSYVQSVRPIAIQFASGSGGHRLKAAIIENGLAMLEHGELGLPTDIEMVEPDGTVWTLDDELYNFTTDTTGLIWDMVCAIFIAAWIVKGKHTNEDEPPPPAPPRVKGANKYAMVRK